MGLLAGGRGSVSQKAGRTQVTQKRPSFPGTSPPPHTHKHTNRMYKVNQEPGRTPDTHSRRLTNTRTEHTWWTRNMAATPADTASHSTNTHMDHTMWRIWPQHPQTPPLTHKHTHGSYNMDQEPGCTTHADRYRVPNARVGQTRCAGTCPPAHSHHRFLTNARMESTVWARRIPPLTHTPRTPPTTY